MILPELFITRMKAYFDARNLSEEADLFFASFDSPGYRGIRMNRQKVAPENDEDILCRIGARAKRVPWCRDGYYVDETMAGKDPFYHAGVYYIQEPSAMLPAEILAAKPGEAILDLCAAPGGKTTRIGADMKGEGILVANEISADRAKALLRNVELFGIRNVIITNEPPERLAISFPSFFDKILIDAPCSGEGMFRRDKNAVKSWETYGPQSCEKMQREILTQAHRMLKPGGEIVYSTCTFNPGENEEMIRWFIDTFSEYTPIDVTSYGKLFHLRSDAPGTLRIWPHLRDGDGHFCAHLRKASDAETFPAAPAKVRGSKYRTESVYSVRQAKNALLSFAADFFLPGAYETFEKRVDASFSLMGDKIHIIPIASEILDGIRVMKMGEFPGEIRSLAQGVAFLPSHAFALTVCGADVREERRIALDRSDDRLRRYLSGETVTLTDDEQLQIADRQILLVTVENYSIGLAKREGPVLKNLYPKAWRNRS